MDLLSSTSLFCSKTTISILSCILGLIKFTVKMEMCAISLKRDNICWILSFQMQQMLRLGKYIVHSNSELLEQTRILAVVK